MKEKIITFGIGFLVGIVLSTGIFCTYSLVSNINDNSSKPTHSIRENVESSGRKSKKEKSTTEDSSQKTTTTSSEEIE